jgi:hypothetical protein
MILPNKKMIFIAAGFVGVLILGGVGFKLYSGISKFDGAEKTLTDSMRSLKRSYASKPFPSSQNVAREKKNVQVLEKWFVTLMTNLREGQVHPDKEKRPSKFMRLLEDKRKKLNALGLKKKPNPLSEDFMFGFSKYLAEGSELPAPDDVPRLTQQLVIVEKLCSLLIDAGVASIDEISRDLFEERVATGRRGQKKADLSKAGLIEGSALSAKFHFEFEITALEDSFWTVINNMASHDMFVVVTDLTITKDPDDIVLPTAKIEDGKDSPKKRRDKKPEAEVEVEDAPKLTTLQQKLAMARRRRVVSGEKFEIPMAVTLGIDVYWFRPEEGK